MTLALDSAGSLSGSSPPDTFGHRLAPPGDPLEGATFDAIYDAKIKPELERREAERRTAIKTFGVALLGGLVAVALENYMTPSLTGGRAHFADPRIEIATMVLAAVLGYLPLAKVAKRAKVAILESLCALLGVDYQLVRPDPPFYNACQALKLLPQANDRAFQDFFGGQRDGVEFELCQASLHEGSGRDRHLVFSGQLIRLGQARRLSSTTVVLRNAGWLNRFECPPAMKPVGLEDPAFNKTFAVFGSDQVEAREILTPTFMQQLDEMDGAYAASHIRCAFTETELLVVIECPPQFEIGGMFSSLVDRGRAERIARRLEQVFKLIDAFRAGPNRP
jgi:hypothetical protein